MNESSINLTGSSYKVQANLQATNAATVTKSDTTTFVPSTLFIGTAGNISIVTASGSTVILKNLANGTFIPVLVTKVLDATTAVDIVRFY